MASVKNLSSYNRSFSTVRSKFTPTISSVFLFLSNSALERITADFWITGVGTDYVYFSAYSEVCWNSQTFGQKHIYIMTQPSDNCSISRYLKRKNKDSHMTHSFIFPWTSEVKMCSAFALRKSLIVLCIVKLLNSQPCEDSSTIQMCLPSLKLLRWNANKIKFKVLEFSFLGGQENLTP